MISPKFYHYNFHMSQTSINVPSIEEISFKLSENILSSLQFSKNILMPIESSLQYSTSRISIQEHLQKDQEFTVAFKKIGDLSTMKDFSEKTTCINSITEQTLKNTSRHISRQKIFSIRKVTARPVLIKRLSLHNIVFEQNRKVRSSRVESPHGKMIKSKAFLKRTKRMSSNQQNNDLLINSEVEKRNFVWQEKEKFRSQFLQIENLKKSFIIKQIQLKNDDQKHRSYLRKIVQTRGVNIHLDEMQTSRKLSRNDNPAVKRY